MAQQQWMSAFAPATIGNLGPGFDVLGMAIAGAGDVVSACWSDDDRCTIERIDGDHGSLPREHSANTAGIAASALLEQLGCTRGVRLRIQKRMPIASGLGSSAASAVAAAFAVNALLDYPCALEGLIQPCVKAEAAVSAPSADNVAAALFGGIILLTHGDPPQVVRLPVPPWLYVVVVSPDMALRTAEARRVLPHQVSLETMVRTTANIAGLIAALYRHDEALLSQVWADDVITHARAPLIPGCLEVLRAAQSAGALGASISGAGPALFALCRGEAQAFTVGTAMRRAFAACGLESTHRVSHAQAPGVRLLDVPL